MPRSCSSFIQSEVAWRAALRPFTEPAIWIAPPNNSSFSVSVVLPASGCEMIAKVRRRRASAATSGMAIPAAAGAGTLGKPPIIRAPAGPPGSRPWRRGRFAEAEDAPGAEHPERQRHEAHAAVGLDGEVQVRPAAVAGAARGADALPAAHPLAGADLDAARGQVRIDRHGAVGVQHAHEVGAAQVVGRVEPNRKSTRLNSSHVKISY